MAFHETAQEMKILNKGACVAKYIILQKETFTQFYSSLSSGSMLTTSTRDNPLQKILAQTLVLLFDLFVAAIYKKNLTPKMGGK